MGHQFYEGYGSSKTNKQYVTWTVSRDLIKSRDKQQFDIDACLYKLRKYIALLGWRAWRTKRPYNWHIFNEMWCDCCVVARRGITMFSLYCEHYYCIRYNALQPMAIKGTWSLLNLFLVYKLWCCDYSFHVSIQASSCCSTGGLTVQGTVQRTVHERWCHGWLHMLTQASNGTCPLPCILLFTIAFSLRSSGILVACRPVEGVASFTSNRERERERERTRHSRSAYDKTINSIRASSVLTVERWHWYEEHVILTETDQDHSILTQLYNSLGISVVSIFRVN